MKRTITLFFAALLAAVTVGCSPQSSSFERASDFNFDWKFTLLPDTTTLTNLPLADDTWRDLRLPHDWSIESSFDKNLEGCTGYLPGGVGVYQKHFKTEYNSAERTTLILFDGVYNNAKFWLNGQYLGENPYGYSPTYFDLTKALKPVGEENVITVYVDHSRYADSRWYTGSGIYRNVKLLSLNKLHIPVWGTFVTTPEVTAQQATVNVEVSVENQLKELQNFTLLTKLYDSKGAEVSQYEELVTMSAGGAGKFNQTMGISNPKLWDCENPNMYKAVTEILIDGVVVDSYTTPFGIRTLLFDKDKGFFLNGISTYVRGVCLHHDGGIVGAAVPEGVWRRRLADLKAGGVNAIRTSHNPFSDEFLDLCDEMGFLVQNEIFDEMDNPKDKRFNMNEREVLYRTRGYTEHFQKWGESDLKRTIIRDRNHPSVFQYSIGNEIEWTYPYYKEVSGLWDKGVGGYWNATPRLTPEQMKARFDAVPPRQYELAETAAKLSRWVKEVDTTRAVTANLIIPVASCVTGYAAALDVVGFSYQIAQYDWCKKHFPDMLFTGSENSGLLEEWKSITDNPMVFSMYMWTGIDYMGESNLKWPQKSFPGDMLDMAGFKKAGWNHFKSIWVDEPMVALQCVALEDSAFKLDKKGKNLIPKKGKSPKWDNNSAVQIWNYEPGEMVVVEIVTNQPEAELCLNGRSLGVKKLSDCSDNIMRWCVPFEAGELIAVAGAQESKIVTAGEVASMEIEVDKCELESDGYDVAHIFVRLYDSNGNRVRSQESRVSFKVEGDVTYLGVDNGWNRSTQAYQSNDVVTHLGRCMAIVQSKRGVDGNATITASVDGLESVTARIEIR